jgi:hypothetical protein
MKPEHETRRKIIREWMSLPKDKRQTEEQAKPFAKKAMERIPSSGDPYRQILGGCCPASVSRDPSEDGRSFATPFQRPMPKIIVSRRRLDSDANCRSYPRPVNCSLR